MNTVFSLLLATCSIHYACSLTKLEDRKKFKLEDFKFNLDESEAAKGSGGGEIRRAFVDQFPALEGERLAFALFDIEPCGVNTPHIHPRASELVYVIHAENLVYGFVEENGGRGPIINTLKTGDVLLIPKSLLHFTQNIGCTMAHVLTAFNHEDPGVITSSTSEFMLPTQILEATYKLPKEEVEAIKSKLVSSLAIGNEKCLKRCGLA